MSRGKHLVKPVVEGGWLDRKQAAARVRISVAMFDRMRANGDGPRAAYFGRLARFRPEWIDRWGEKLPKEPT